MGMVFSRERGEASPPTSTQSAPPSSGGLRSVVTNSVVSEADAAEMSAANAAERKRAAAARAAAKRQMHRINTIRQREGVSLRSASRRMRVDIRSLRAQEDESNDILLSTLYKWQQILDVPIQELLIDSAEPLTPVVLQRARMVKVMKTVAAIRERCEQKSVGRLTEMLVEQLLEIMPELKDVSPWHSVGQRRGANEMGRAAEHRLPDDFFGE
jgi:transcriptional regulator with XRE-family HTH domain